MDSNLKQAFVELQENGTLVSLLEDMERGILSSSIYDIEQELFFTPVTFYDISFVEYGEFYINFYKDPFGGLWSREGCEDEESEDYYKVDTIPTRDEWIQEIIERNQED